MRGHCVALLAVACAAAPSPRGVTPSATPPAGARAVAGGPEPDDGAPTPLEADALERVRAALSPSSAGVTSGALTHAARDLARRAAAGEPRPLAAASLRRALAAAGAIDPAPAGVLLAAPPREVAQALARAARLQGATHLGVGIEVRDGTAWAVLLAAERRAELDPFPRRVAPGGREVLRGRLVGLGRPRVYVASPSGGAGEVPVHAADGRFEVVLTFEEAGRWRVEVMGDGPGGPTVAAILDTEAGPAAESPAPPSAAGPFPAPSAAPSSPADPASFASHAVTDDGTAADEEQVLRAIDVRRRSQGLAPLRPDPRLAAQARRHSAAMLAAGSAAHILRGGEDVVGRLRAAGVPFRHALENVARGDSAGDAQRAVEDSPGHLASLLSPQAQDVGVGVAHGEIPGGQPVTYLTQILVEPVDEGERSARSPEGRAQEAIAAERARHGLPPLAAEATLDALARETAREMLRRGDPDPGDLAARALALRSGRDGRSGTKAAADAFVAGSPLDAARSRNVADPRFRRVGVGVARGDSARFGVGLYWIAVVYAE